MTEDRRAIIVSRIKLVLLALCFLGPLAVAWIWYANVDNWRPEGAGAGGHGELFQPPRLLEDVALRTVDGEPLDGEYFRGRWTMVYVGGRECDEACESRLYYSRQIRTAMGRDIQRVQRLYVLTEMPPADELAGRVAEHPDLTVATPVRGGFLDRFRHADEEPAVGHRIYLVDPLGNLMMSFPPEVDPRDLRDDLRHLLRVSRIG